MNPHDEDPIPAFDDGVLEREWLAQEAAMRRERLQLDPAGDDARRRRYRLIARQLRQPPADSLPADFARQLAARVASAPAGESAAGASFESRLMLALLAILVIAAGAVVALYGNSWLPSFTALLPRPQAPAIRWLLALAACLGASWLMGLWQRHAPHDHR